MPPYNIIHASLILIPRLFYRYCLVGIGIMFAGVLYWAAWRILMPKVFGYELLPRKETLDDGTVVTVVSICVFHSVFCWFWCLLGLLTQLIFKFSNKKIE